MFDLGFGIGEIIILVLVALIVVGPYDLPNMLYKTGKFFGNLRNMASEFKYAMDDIAHEQEIEHTKKQLQAEISDTSNTIEKNASE